MDSIYCHFHDIYLQDTQFGMFLQLSYPSIFLIIVCTLNLNMVKADYHIEQMRSTKELLLLLKKKRMYANAYIHQYVCSEKCVLQLCVWNKFLLAIVSELHPHILFKCYPLHIYENVQKCFITIVNHKTGKFISFSKILLLCNAVKR